jgi:hypothetical protein
MTASAGLMAMAWMYTESVAELVKLNVMYSGVAAHPLRLTLSAGQRTAGPIRVCVRPQQLRG